MAGVKHYIRTRTNPGMYDVKFSNYKYFFDYIQMELLEYKQYIYRGQRDSIWKLESTLDREFAKRKISRNEINTKVHLDNFILASRGRANNYLYANHNNNEWWALGQHYGLATPLLDWSESPFVALFFAFRNQDKSTSRNRSVYAISKNVINLTKNFREKKGLKEFVELVNPISIDNSRLVNQRGLLLSMPANSDIELYLKDNLEPTYDKISFYKFTIPDTNRENILKYLNKMNISSLTLFPDLVGASEFANTQLIIDKY